MQDHRFLNFRFHFSILDVLAKKKRTSSTLPKTTWKILQNKPTFLWRTFFDVIWYPRYFHWESLESFHHNKDVPVLNVWDPLDLLTGRPLVLSSRPIRFGRTMLLITKSQHFVPHNSPQMVFGTFYWGLPEPSEMRSTWRYQIPLRLERSLCAHFSEYSATIQFQILYLRSLIQCQCKS